MRAWIGQHVRAMRAAAARFRRAPLGNVLNMLVLGIALSLPLALVVIIDNLQTSARHVTGEPQLNVFMDATTGSDDSSRIGARLRSHPSVRSFRFVSRDQAITELRQASGLADLIETLPDNPLPDAYVVTASDGSPRTLEALRDDIKAWPHVAEVQLDAVWARRLDAALRVARIVVALIAGLLAIAQIGRAHV